MDLGTLANVGEILGGVGMIVSLVYLAIQIRAHAGSQHSENYARSLERMAAMQERFAVDRPFTALFNRGLVDPDGLSVTEKIQFMWAWTELFGNLEFLCFQAGQKSIPAALWTRWEETLKWWLTFPGVQAVWHARPTPFTPEFTACVERCLASGYRPETPGAWEAFLARRPDARAESGADPQA